MLNILPLFCSLHFVSSSLHWFVGARQNISSSWSNADCVSANANRAKGHCESAMVTQEPNRCIQKPSNPEHQNFVEKGVGLLKFNWSAGSDNEDFPLSVSGQFKACRDALRSDLSAVGAEVVVQEDFQQHGASLLEKLERYITLCDRVIALVGDAYGFEPEETARPAGQPRRSYTQWEYFFAMGERLNGSRQPPKDIFLYFASPEFLAMHAVSQADDAAQLQQEFIKELHRSGKDWNQFGLLDELRALVLRDGVRIPGLTAPELRNRRDLLNEVKGQVANRIAQSLHSGLINLPKEKQPKQVRRPWDVEVKLSHQPSTVLPPGTEIIDVFDQDAIAGKLLVLGAPGAGKTMTLLQLAKELTARAETDAAEPMPVLLNLSSWKDDNKSLSPWLEAELKFKYGVRRAIGKHWIDERCLLPLLDGLDELKPACQDKCVEAINQFQQEYRPEHLVVCCRLDEYQNSKTKLQLNGAIYLQPLTSEHIHSCLIATFPELWSIIQADAELLEKARTPLLLSIITVVYKETPIQDRPTFHLPLQRDRYLFDVYVEKMLSRETKGNQYSKDKTRTWLTWLGKSLRDRAQTEFLIDKLQPSWLCSLAQKWLYHILVVLIAAVAFGIFDWLKDWLVPQLISEGPLTSAVRGAIQQKLGGDVSQLFQVLVNTSFALIVGLILGLMKTIRPIETVQWSGARARSELRRGSRRWGIACLTYGPCVGLIAGLLASSLFYLNYTRPLPPELVIWGRLGGGAGILIAAVVVLFLITRPNIWLDAELRDRVTAGWADTLISALTCGLIFWLSAGLLIGVFAGLSFAAIAGLSHALGDRPAYRMTDTLMVVIIGWLLSGVITWLTGALLLKVLEGPLIRWMDLWLYSWVGVGATAKPVAGLIAKRLRKKAQPAETLQRPETELWNWRNPRWRQGLIAGVVAAAISSVILILLMGLGQMRTVQAIGAGSCFFGMGLVFTLCISVFTALMAAAIAGSLGFSLGALFGMLRGGLTGPDIERRTAPNQGIRNSAINAAAFALIGGLTLGALWGLLNMLCAMLMSGLVPEASDWLGFLLPNVLLFAFLSGLVPGAACVQHFALRLILWCRGLAPWKYADFLDYATERMLLQRVGGRYRFFHEQLRDHFAAMGPKR